MIQEFQIDCTNVAAPKVIVGGTDVTPGLRACRLDLAAGEFPLLTLEVTGKGSITGQAEVREYVATDIAAWLDRLDPGQLEADMLKEFGLNGVQSTAESAIAVLRRWAG